MEPGYVISLLKANRALPAISHVCDVDGNILKKFANSVQQEMGEAPAAEKTIAGSRAEDVDAITIAPRTTGIFFTPMAHSRLLAGKHSTWKSMQHHIHLKDKCW